MSSRHTLHLPRRRRATSEAAAHYHSMAAEARAAAEREYNAVAAEHLQRAATELDAAAAQVEGDQP